MTCCSCEVVLDREPKWGTFQERLWDGLKEWAQIISSAAVIIGFLLVLGDALGHLRLTVDHNWWVYRVWKRYWHWWPITVPHSLATVVALLAPMEKNEPTRWQLLLKCNSAAAGLWGFLFGIFWTVERLGPWLGIPIFLSVFLLGGIAWTRLDSRFGYWLRSAR